jgi:hypothetical protein
MSTRTNAQVAIQASAQYGGSTADKVLERADRFKSWLDDADAKDKQSSQTDLEDAWNKGHESGFWNGRQSAGSGEVAGLGVDHAKANNPFSARVPDDGGDK